MTLFHVVFHFPAELASCCCQRLVIQGQTVASRIINNAALKMYAQQTAYFLSVYHSAGSGAAHQDAGVCICKHSLEFLATRCGI